MIFLTRSRAGTWPRLVSCFHPTIVRLRSRSLLCNLLEARTDSVDSLANDCFYSRPLCQAKGEFKQGIDVGGLLNSLSFINKSLPNMEKPEEQSIQPVISENTEMSMKGTQYVESTDMTKEVTDVNQKDSPANQNFLTTGSFTQGQTSSFSKNEIVERDQHLSEEACCLAATSDGFPDESPNLNSPCVVDKKEDDLIASELSSNETRDMENSKSLQNVCNQKDSDLSCDDDSLGLDTLFDETLQSTDVAKPKPRQRIRKKRGVNEQDLHCDEDSLGLETLFDEDLQRRDATRWMIHSKTKSKQRKLEKRKRKRQLNALSDDDDTDIASTNVGEEDSPSSKPRKKPKRIMPNYFVAIRVSNPHIRSGVKIVQDSIVTHNEKLKPALIPLAMLHLTLLVVHLKDDDQILKATDILQHCRTSLEPILQNSSLTLNFSGLDHFQHQVLFVKLCGDEGIAGLNTVANIVRETFTKEGIPSTDSRDFKPHLTVMKLTRSPKLRKKGIKKIPTECYANWLDLSFGEETVNALHLCSMNAKDKDGFYKCVATVKFEPDNEPDTKLPSRPENIPTDNNVKAMEITADETAKEPQETLPSTDLPGDMGSGSVEENLAQDSESCLSAEVLSKELSE